MRLELFHGKCEESSFLSLVCNAGQSNSRGLDLASGAKEGHEDAILLSGRQQQFPAVSSLRFTSTARLPPEQQLFLPARAVEKMKAHCQKFGGITVICAFPRREEGLSLLTAPTKRQVFSLRFACAFSIVTRMAKPPEDS